MIILVIVGLYVLGSITGGMQFYMMTWAGQHVLRNIRVEVFERIHRLSLGYYSKNEAGDVMSRITNDTDTLQQAIGFALMQVMGGAVLVGLDRRQNAQPELGLCAHQLHCLALYGHCHPLVQRPGAQSLPGDTRRKSAMSMPNCRKASPPCAKCRPSAVKMSTSRASAKAMPPTGTPTSALWLYTSALAPVLDALGFVAIAVVVCVGGILLLQGGSLGGTVVSLGLIVAFLGYAQRFNQPIRQIAVLWTNIQSAIAGAERIFDLLDEVPDIVEKPNAKAMPTITGTVVFDNVSAAYNPDEPVLKGVTLEAEPGQTVAIVGPTGAGKTTIINLIPRFYDVTDGSINIDGIDVRDVTLASLRKQIGIVLQDTFLFSDTVMNNIRFGLARCQR